MKMRSSTTPVPPILAFLLISVSLGTEFGTATNINVGVILDMGTWIGNISWSSVSMAIDDFYASHPNYTTRIVLHLRDSKEDVVSAASAALDLLQNLRVQAIIGPQTSSQAKFIIELGSKSKTPIISHSATSPLLSSPRTPYFIRTAVSDSNQATAIAALAQSLGWTTLVPIFEDSEYGIGIIPCLLDALHTTEARVPYHSIISLDASDDQILQELYNLKTMQIHAFVVHASNYLASRLLLKAKEVGMMKEGYAWIITYGLTDHPGFMDSSTIDALHGVLTVKPHISSSPVLRDFNNRWREQFRRENPTITTKLHQPSVYALWAYDTAWALAMAAESLSLGRSKSTEPKFNVTGECSCDLEQLVTQLDGPSLLNSMSSMKFKGVSGEFQLVRGQLDSSMKFEIIHIIAGKNKRIGFWTRKRGMSRKLMSEASLERVVMQPGRPKAMSNETTRKRLKIGVPVKSGFLELVNKEWNPLTRRIGSGFSIEVFDMVVRTLPYEIQYEYIFYENSKGEMNGSYDDLVYQIYLGNFDAVVGDVTITPNRSSYVDFTVPYSEPGMSMVVPLKADRSAWTFVKPLSTGLWLATGAFFVYTGFVVWMLEHRINNSFRGTPLKQLGTTLYFSLSTMVFAHREKLISNFTKAVVIIWLFAVFILTSSYTASLSSILTVQQLHPTFTSVQDIVRNGDYVGFCGDYYTLRSLNIDMSRFKTYESIDGYHEALRKGNSGGGISATIAEMPYIKIFLSKYCRQYTIAGDTYNSPGFAFAFPKGSPLVADMSKGILKLQEEIDQKIPWSSTRCPEQGSSSTTSNSLSFASFRGLFLVTGITSTFALILFVIFSLYENRHALGTNNSGRSMWQRLVLVLKLLHHEDNSSLPCMKNSGHTSGNSRPAREIPERRIYLHT